MAVTEHKGMPGFALVIGKPKDKSEDDGGESELADKSDKAQHEEDGEAAGQDLLDAIASKDPKAVYQAVCEMVQHHQLSEDSEEDSESDSEEKSEY